MTDDEETAPTRPGVRRAGTAVPRTVATELTDRTAARRAAEAKRHAIEARLAANDVREVLAAAAATAAAADNEDKRARGTTMQHLRAGGGFIVVALGILVFGAVGMAALGKDDLANYLTVGALGTLLPAIASMWPRR